MAESERSYDHTERIRKLRKMVEREEKAGSEDEDRLAPAQTFIHKHGDGGVASTPGGGRERTTRPG